MSAALYDQAIKALARAAHGAGAPAPGASRVQLDNPYCGDRIELALQMDGGRIGALTHRTRGCLLCQAAASVVGLRAPGADVAQVGQAAAALEAVLSGAALPPGAWPELEVFRPVRDYPARHGCVGLPVRALLEAVADAQATGASRSARPAAPAG